MQSTGELYNCFNSPTNTNFFKPTISQTSHCKPSPDGLAFFTPFTKPPWPLATGQCHNEPRGTHWAVSLSACSPANIPVVQPPKGHQAVAALLALLVLLQPASTHPQHRQVCSFSKRWEQHTLTQLPAPRKRRNLFSFRVGLHYWADHAQTGLQLHQWSLSTSQADLAYVSCSLLAYASSHLHLISV